jgi:hypothetical protein
MAPELENYWFERVGGRCNARTISWQGGLLISLYILAVTAVTTLLIDRTIIGFLAALVLTTGIFLWIAAAKTRGGLGW